MPEISGIAEGGRYEADFEGLRLVVERHLRLLAILRIRRGEL